MKLQTIFLENLDSVENLNYDCETYVREKEANFGEASYNNLEFDTSCPQSQFDRFKRNTFHQKSRNDVGRDAHMGLRRTATIDNYTAQLPRSTKISGVNTSRSVYVSPQGKARLSDSVEPTPTPGGFASENVQSTCKPPKSIRKCNYPNMSLQPKSRNYLQGKNIGLQFRKT